MKKNNIDPITELHKIREKYYEETKNMTIEEEINYINNTANKILEDKKKTYNFDDLYKTPMINETDDTENLD